VFHIADGFETRRYALLPLIPTILFKSDWLVDIAFRVYDGFFHSDGFKTHRYPAILFAIF
jgi:hypothetical protein